MKASGIGGQAVMEGVMMKNSDKYAVAVRKPDKEIVIDVQEYRSIGEKYPVLKLPIIRGVVAFAESMSIGIKTLTYSASFFDEEDDKSSKKKPKKTDLKNAKKKEHVMIVGTACLSVLLAVGIFILFPYFISMFLSSVIASDALLAVCEGIIRLALFIGYVVVISLLKDIKRVFMYHGAEHKSINCIEHGYELTVENVRKQSKQHKRCGTSFLLFVMLISIIFFVFIRVDTAWLRVLLRVLLIPVIAGIAYEFIKAAGKSDSIVINILSRPGLWLQGLTTREPDDDMIEVAIASVEAVFDWKAFLTEYLEKDACSVHNDGVNDELLKGTEETAVSVDETAASVIDDTVKENVTADTEMADKIEKSEKQQDKGYEVKRTRETEIIQGIKPGLKKEEKNETNQYKGQEVKQEKKQEVKQEKKLSKNPSEWPTIPLIDDDEDDEILKKLDQYFTLKKRNDDI